MRAFYVMIPVAIVGLALAFVLASCAGKTPPPVLGRIAAECLKPAIADLSEKLLPQAVDIVSSPGPVDWDSQLARLVVTGGPDAASALLCALRQIHDAAAGHQGLSSDPKDARILERTKAWLLAHDASVS